MNDLRVTTIQADLVWENRTANLEHFSGLMASISEPTDLIVLPEMFTTGFSMRPEETAEPFNLEMETILWMREKARQHDAAITGSVSVSDNGVYFNRLLWVEPSGAAQYVDKRHRFSMGKEDAHFGAGTKRVIIDYKGCKILPLVCYDLRFPVWCRNKLINNIPEYDMCLFVANWPEARILHWDRLLTARAIENQCFAVGVNRVGADINGTLHCGGTAIYGPMGEALQTHPDNTQGAKTCLLEDEYLQKVRRYLSFLKDGDQFSIQV